MYLSAGQLFVTGALVLAEALFFALWSVSVFLDDTVASKSEDTLMFAVGLLLLLHLTQVLSSWTPLLSPNTPALYNYLLAFRVVTLLTDAVVFAVMLATVDRLARTHWWFFVALLLVDVASAVFYVVVLRDPRLYVLAARRAPRLYVSLTLRSVLDHGMALFVLAFLAALPWLLGLLPASVFNALLRWGWLHAVLEIPLWVNLFAIKTSSTAHVLYVKTLLVVDVLVTGVLEVVRVVAAAVFGTGTASTLQLAALWVSIAAGLLKGAVALALVLRIHGGDRRSLFLPGSDIKER